MGFFANKPDQAEVDRLFLASQKTIPVFVRLAQQRVTYDDGKVVDLSDPGQRIAVVAALEAVVKDLQLTNVPPSDVDAFVERSKSLRDHMNSSTYEVIGPISDLANNIAAGLNFYEGLWYVSYKMYPKYGPIRELADNTGRITVRAMERLFDRVPDSIRPAFPRFTAAFVDICGDSEPESQPAGCAPTDKAPVIGTGPDPDPTTSTKDGGPLNDDIPAVGLAAAMETSTGGVGGPNSLSNPHKFGTQVSGLAVWLILQATFTFLAASNRATPDILGAVLGISLAVAIASATFADAWQSGIYKRTGKRSFLNISPMAWGIVMSGLFVVAYPAYLIARNRLRTIQAGNGLFTTVIVLGGIKVAAFVVPLLAIL